MDVNKIKVWIPDNWSLAPTDFFLVTLKNDISWMLLLPRPQKWILQWLPQHTLVVLSHVHLFVRVCKGIKGHLTVPFWMNFRKTSKRSVTPSPAPPLFPKTVVRFFLDVLKSATKIFWSEMAHSLLLELFQKVIQNGKGKRPWMSYM